MLVRVFIPVRFALVDVVLEIVRPIASGSHHASLHPVGVLHTAQHRASTKKIKSKNMNTNTSTTTKNKNKNMNKNI